MKEVIKREPFYKRIYKKALLYRQISLTKKFFIC